jgi:hypothetical protein
VLLLPVSGTGLPALFAACMRRLRVHYGYRHAQLCFSAAVGVLRARMGGRMGCLRWGSGPSLAETRGN